MDMLTDPNCSYDDVVNIRAEEIEPTITWGTNPGQAISIDENIPRPEDVKNANTQQAITDSLAYMKFKGGQTLKGQPIDVAFIGSCTNGRLSDLEEVAHYVKGHQVAENVKAIIVPGSQITAKIAEQKGLDKIFSDAGFEWRAAGCSMCLAMNPDKLIGDQLCASSSNRNFKGRQGSPTGRTLLMSPIMVAAAAINGKVSDAREIFNVEKVEVA